MHRAQTGLRAEGEPEKAASASNGELRSQRETELEQVRQREYILPKRIECAMLARRQVCEGPELCVGVKLLISAISPSLLVSFWVVSSRMKCRSKHRTKSLRCAQRHNTPPAGKSGIAT